jgi:tetratricopeptide (TPR) repeat protein
MARSSLLLALFAVGCGSASSSDVPPAPIASAPVAQENTSFPQHRACQSVAGLFHPAPLDGQGGEECIGSPPWDPDYGRAHFDNGRFEQAGDCFAAAYEREPTHFAWAIDAGIAYAHARRKDLARFYFRHVVRYAPGTDFAERARHQLVELEP